MGSGGPRGVVSSTCAAVLVPALWLLGWARSVRELTSMSLSLQICEQG